MEVYMEKYKMENGLYVDELALRKFAISYYAKYEVLMDEIRKPRTSNHEIKKLLEEKRYMDKFMEILIHKKEIKRYITKEKKM